jgi:hypothetical protein
VVRFEPTEEPALHHCPWCKTQPGILDHRHRVLVLMTLAWQHRRPQPLGDLAGAGGQAMKLQCVGGEADTVAQ